MTGHATKDEDEVEMLLPARTLNTVLFFSDRGKVYSEKAYQIPDADRTGRGISIMNVLAIDPDETVTAAMTVPEFDDEHYVIMATRKGKMKRMALSTLASVRSAGIIAIGLAKGDELGWVRMTDGNDDVILVTRDGQAVRFKEDQIRSMGRTAAGVTGIRLSKGDILTSMEVVEPGGDLLVVTEKGFGKRTPLSETFFSHH